MTIPVTADPVTADPVTAEPVIADPVTADPVTAAPVTAEPAAPGPGSWRLTDTYGPDTQGLVVSPFSHLPETAALLLDCSGAPGGAWLLALRAADGCGLRITPGSGKEGGPVSDGEAASGCAAIAFTAPGLRLLGVDDATLASFALPFVEGMHTGNRRRRLGDVLLELPGRANNPLWGGNGPVEAPDPGAATCDLTIHAALLLYHETPEQLAAMAAPVRACLAASGVTVAHELTLSLMADGTDPPLTREHFGFADGISQPSPYGAGIVDKQGHAYPQDPAHGVASGDLLIGHINAHDEPAPGPVVAASLPGTGVLPAMAGSHSGRDLGLNGSYLVIREMSQDVGAFWASMAAAATQIGAPDADWVAERVIGRTKDGVILAADPPPATADGPGNAFMFWAGDADGRHCPLGAHVRRSNPRDGLAATAGDRATLLHAANNHRILRRGRKYAAYALPGGPSLPGLLFMCLNTDLERQFEFVQQTWLMNPSFATLFNERDPLLGPKGQFTIPAAPLRLKPEIDTFVHLIGGEYFFLPSLPALAYFAGLAPPGSAVPVPDVPTAILPAAVPPVSAPPVPAPPVPAPPVSAPPVPAPSVPAPSVPAPPAAMLPASARHTSAPSAPA